MKKNRKHGKGRAGTRLIAGLLALVLFFSSLGLESYALEATQAGLEEVVDKEPEATQAALEEVVVKAPTTALTAMEDNEEVFTTTIVNPHYKDVISVQELNAYLDSVKDEEILPSIGILSDTVYDSVEAAGAYLRSEMLNRVQTITINIDMSIYQMDKFYELLLNKAFEHTEECSGQEGDALERTYGGCRISYGTSGGRPYVTYEMQYYTTLAQEQELTLKVNSIMQELQLQGKTEAEKVKLIHDKICELTDYDYTNLNNPDYKLKYTAYAALCQGTAVCQGYAIAFYRLCKEAQIPVRIITGLGGNEAHAWNIVKIGEFYYNIDCTWDGQTAETEYRYYLQNEIDFAKHTRDPQFDTEEFHLQYPMAEYSYGKETLDRLNVENLDRTLTSIEEEAVSTRAEGKPKLLVFIHPTDSNSISSVESIAQVGLKDVDIVVTDLNKSPKDTVQAFKNNYAGTNSEMIFCYDTGNTANSIFWSYAYAAGITGGVYYPMFCYIDADNKLQYFEYGAISGKHLEDVLVRACDYGHKKYTITYYLDGGTNSPENPSEFTVDMGTLELKTPTREGYDFVGWYRGALDGELLENGRLQLTAGNKRLYAKWSVKTYEVTLNPNGGQLANNKITVSHSGVYPQLPVPAKEGYSFLGWYTQLSGGTKVEQGSSIIRNENHSLYARWEAKNITVLLDAKEGEVTPGTITVAYGNPYGNLPVPVREGYSFLGWEEEDGTPVTAQTIMTKPETHKLYARWEVKKYTLTLDAGEGTLPESQKSKEITYGQAYGTLPTPTREGYQFLGWYTAQNSKISESTIVQVTENQALYARYQVINYSIRYELNGGSNHPDNPTQYNVETDSFTLKVPTGNQGADFEGWYGESTFTNKVTQITKGSKGNITLYAGWKLRMPTFSSEMENIVAGQKIELISHNPAAKIYYTLDGTTPDKGKNLYTEAITITEDVTIRVIAIAEGYISSQVAEQSFHVYTSQLALDRLEISLRRSATETLRAIALPSGRTEDDLQWISKNEGIVKVEKGVLTPIAVGTTVVEAAITDAGGERLVVECKVTILPNIYQITFLDREGNTLSEQEVEEEKAASAPEMEQIPGYTFEGWDQDISRITESITVNPVYSLNTYTITYFRNGEPVETENPGEYTIEDEQITLRPLVLQQGEKFAGWYDNPEFTGEEILSIPANSQGNRRLYGKVEYERYTISYVLEEGMTQGENPTSYTVKDIIQLKAPGEREGFLFDGWYESQAFDGSPLEVIEKRTGNITLYPGWKLRKPTFSIQTENIVAGQTIELISDNPLAKIYYTLDGTTPDQGKNLYTEAITPTEDVTIRAIAIAEGYISSQVAEQSFRVYTSQLVLDKSEISLRRSEKETLRAIALPSGKTADDLQWKSRNEGVVKVDKGVLTPIAVGTTVVEAAITDAGGERLVAECRVTILPNIYQVTFLDREGNTLSEQEVEEEKAASAPEMEQIPGYTFEGWDQDISGITESITVRPVYSLNTYTITYFLNGEPAETENPGEYTIEDGQITLKPPVPEQGERFAGWYDNPEFTGEEILSIPANSMGNRMLYGKIEYERYTISYVLEEGITPGENPASYTVKDIIQLKAPGEKEGFLFAGWYESQDFEGNPLEIIEKRTGNITLYPRWRDERGLWMEEIEPLTYTGKKVQPSEIKVYDGSTLLLQGKDYTVSYKNNINAYYGQPADSPKAPSVIIKGKGNYTGKIIKTFEILPKSLEDEDVFIDDIALAYKANKKQLAIPKVAWNKKKLSGKKDFSVLHIDSSQPGAFMEPGEYSIQVEGKNNYCGQRTIKLHIAAKEEILMGKVKVQKIPEQPYTGKELEVSPLLQLTYKGDGLTEGTDYRIEHEPCVAVGSHTVLIHGMGRFKGTVRTTLKIAGISMGKVIIAGMPDDRMYNGLPYDRMNPNWMEPSLYITNERKEQVTISPDDYEISFDRNLNKGNAQLIFTGKNGFSGTKKKTVKITAYDISNNPAGLFRVEMPKESVFYEKGGAKPEPQVYFGDRLLVKNVDYKLSYTDNKSVNTFDDSKRDANLIVTGMGNFRGGYITKFEIWPQSLEEVTVYVPDKEAGGAGKYISKPKLTDKNGKVLKAGTDYDSAMVYLDESGQELNKKAILPAGSTVTVQVKGKGNYEGEVIASYRILEKKKSLAKAKITLEKGKKWYYTGDKVYITPDDFTVKIGKVTLDAGDYAIISHTNNVKKGTARVTIEGRGEYGGRKEFTFKINSQTMKWWEKLFHTTVQAAQNTLTMLGEPEAPQVRMLPLKKMFSS